MIHLNIHLTICGTGFGDVYKDGVCHKCGKMGHLDKVCRSAPQKEEHSTSSVEKPDVESDDHSLLDDHSLPDDQPTQQISVVRQGVGHHFP